MVNLFEDRLELVLFFIYCGVDYFGLWFIKEGCKELKCYGVLFICLLSWVIYFEVFVSLEIDLFINVLCWFINCWGFVWMIRCD